MTNICRNSDAADEEKLKFESVLGDEALGLNRHTQQEFLETAETPSLLVILTSLLQDLLSNGSSSESSSSDGCSAQDDSTSPSGAAGAAGVRVQQKTRREREKRPLAEDIEYLRAMACSAQDQQPREGPPPAKHQQTQPSQEQGLRHGTAPAAHRHLGPPAPYRQPVESEEQQQKVACELDAIQEMISASTAPPAAASGCSPDELQEAHHEAAAPLEAVAFVLEEDSPGAVSPTEDVGRLSSSSSYESDTPSSGSCCTTSTQRSYEYTSRCRTGDSSKQASAEQSQQRPVELLVERQWCSEGAPLQKKEGEEEVDSLYPTRCSSGDEQQWGTAATAAASARAACTHATGRGLSQEQQEALQQERLLQQEQLQQEQAQQSQLKELMWGVAAAFEIQQLLPPRVRARSKRLREKLDREKNSRQSSSPVGDGGCSGATTDGCSSSSARTGDSSSTDSATDDGRRSGESGRIFCACSSASSATGSRSAGSSSSSSSSSVNVRGSTSCTTACRASSDSICTSQMCSTCSNACANEPCSGGSSSSIGAVGSNSSVAVSSSSSSNVESGEVDRCTDTCRREETASGIAGGGHNTADSNTYSRSDCSSSNNTGKRRLNTSEEGGSSVECRNHCCLHKDKAHRATASQSVGREDNDTASSTSSRVCPGDRKCDRRTPEEPVMVKRLKKDRSIPASSNPDGSGTSSSDVMNLAGNSCAVCSSSSGSGLGSPGGHNGKTSRSGSSTSARCSEGSAACVQEEALSSSTSGDGVAKDTEGHSRSSDGGDRANGHTRQRRVDRSCGSRSSDDMHSERICAGSSTSSVCSSSTSSIACESATGAANMRDVNTDSITHSLSCSVSGDGSGVRPAATGASEQGKEDEEEAATDEFPAWRCCCGEGGAEAPAAVWKRRGLLQYDVLYDRWHTFLTQFAPSGMALAACFGKSYLFHILHESLWQLLEELRLTAAGETPQRLRTFVLRLAAAAGLSSSHAEQLLSKTLFQHGNPADSILPSETGLGFLHRDAGGAREEQLGIISFCCITNDRQPQHLLQLLTVKSIFSRQLPKMPREYIVRLVFDRNHFTFCLCKRGRVTGGVCFRPYFKERFAEIAFLAVTSTEQVKGYGTRLMNHLKEHVKKSNIEYFLTYADNFALGYFRKQGFSSRITMPRDRWVGYIKDYDGGTLMECKISQKINYLQLSQLLAKQKLAVKRFIDENPGKLLSPLEIPALVKLGYTAAHWLSMQPLLPAAAASQSTGDSEEQQSSRRDGITGAGGVSSQPKMTDDGSKQRDPRSRGPEGGEGRDACTISSSGWRGAVPAANDGGSATPAKTLSGGVSKPAGVHPYLHLFGATAGASIVAGSAGQSFKARVAALLTCLEKHSSSWPFRKPVSVNEAPDYYEVICRPMDISSMKKKNRAGEYQTVAAVRADLQLMFDNCRLYNSQDTIYYKYADELQAFIWPKLNVLEESAGA